MADRKNCEGYSDPTAYAAELTVERETERNTKKLQDVDKLANDLIGALKFAMTIAGFEPIGRIQFRHRASGREYR